MAKRVLREDCRPQSEPMSGQQSDQLSGEELRQEILQEKKKAVRSLVLAVAALVAIIALCIAWFVGNHMVHGGSTQIAATMGEAYELASVGERQTVEEEHFLDDNFLTRLSGGKEKTYSSYYDTETKKTVQTEETTYYLGLSGTAWRQAGQIEMEPGNSGKLELYIIPKRDGLKSIDITLKTEAYQLESKSIPGSGTKQKAVRIEDKKIQNLIDGHILMFRHLDDEKGYSGWISPKTLEQPDADAGDSGNVFRMTAQEAGIDGGTFTKGTLYKVTVYWVWPKYIRNYIYRNRAQYGDLFTDKSSEEDYQKINEFLNDQKAMSSEDGSKLFYPGEKGTDATVGDFTIDSSITDDQLASCSKFYNLADELIGKNVQVIYVGALLD